VNRFRFFVLEALRSIRSNAATTLAATVTVLIVTFLLGVSVTLGRWLYGYTVSVRGDVTLKLYLPPKAADSSALRDEVGNAVGKLPYVKSFEYVSPDEALQLISPRQRREIRDTLNVNPLPPAFYIKLTDPDRVALVAQRAQSIEPVRDCGAPPCITYGKKTTDRVLSTTKYVLYGIGVVVVLLGVAAVVLIANTIRLSIFSRRREIEVMKLVGATNWFVRLPFVLEGMITGVLGAVTGLVLLVLAYTALAQISEGLKDPLNAVGVPMLALLLTGFGLFLGAAGSALTLRRFLRV
jgi:cell division transport system permease protein